MLQHFLKLLQYDNWANQRVLNALHQANDPDERSIQLFWHLLAAEEIWLKRIKNEIPDNQILWQIHSLEACIQKNELIHKDWNDFLHAITDQELYAFVVYKNTEGKEFHTPLQDIITHVFNHSTYHRGQIITLLKGKLEDLPATDYIAFVREKS